MKKISANPWINFLPFLAIYIIIAGITHQNEMQGDEGRYYMFAQNLAAGFYSPKAALNLWNGPGYPLVLVPFVWMNSPLLIPVLLNAFFQYVSLVFLFKSLKLLVSSSYSWIFSLCWAFYYVAYKELGWLYTEPLSSCLLCLFLYFFIKFVLSDYAFKYLISAGFFLGYLALTKVIFGYVILILLVILLAGFLLFKKQSIVQSAKMVLIALLINIPYLAYTYQQTGKLFYWANSGGMSLYWASTPFEGEWGDWNDDHFTAYCGYDTIQPCNADLFALHHQADYDSIYQFQGVARDDAFKMKALQNIRQYPGKYLKNCIANAGRLFFGLPFSYQYPRLATLARIPAGAFVFFLCIFSIISMLFYRGPYQIILLFLLTLLIVFLGATLAVATYQRMLTVVVPLIFLLTAVQLLFWMHRLSGPPK
ncbi:MAG: hypothetical protein EBX50_08995 [Chitinophagia bacterium]|nr:hypothetical protein [Chitinophagia bacterium]